jgi:hypothetical protein
MAGGAGETLIQIHFFEQITTVPELIPQLKSQSVLIITIAKTHFSHDLLSGGINHYADKIISKIHISEDKMNSFSIRQQ